MRRKLSVWLLPTLLAAIFLIPMSAFASEVEISDSELELLNLGFEPLDMNDDYIVGTTAPNNKIYFYERATGTTYNVGFTDPYTFVRDVDMKVQGRYFYFTTYQYAGYSEHDYTIMRYDFLTDSSEELIYNPKIITIQGVSDSGLIYTQDNIIYGNELYYYDFRTGKETHLASKVGSAHMSGNIITYSVVSSNIMERNESVYYVQTNALTNKIPVPYGGEYVKTNGKYIAYWYNNSFLSNERTVLIYNISTKEVYDYSYYY
ncbi:hypothetical protein SAMN05880501_101205 [Ureibacillus xyleni]|uniref:DUF5050 domain-containing protein n=1 Tax=Ureibacillus xyleni TaxID=614648 RepID=A0A285R9F9_9BACL|nr:hypothetical protein [Ureibacillus xyleni]SOB90746.1 hypothetical protein SAMN05880501_101205 [Ureibacillus xyleni]